ncbi:MAG: hypothetical protein MUP98_14210 [Candidatus Aminicenantes bacterium]|nr:hypothetical protein [Candidatus Aminicenantes bacterium]
MNSRKIMSNSLRIRIGIIFLFILLIFVHLLPLSLHPGDALNDTRDCVLNTWIPGWVQQQIFKNPLKLFDTNAFYPNANTLSYSEHLLPQALISLPVRLLTQNPIAVYNFIFFFSFFLNAYGMFLLIRHLTKNDFIGIVCGIIFAFNTYQINQITHLQLLSSGLIPLAFLYLHKYLEELNLKNSILFSTFFTLQSLACIYYGLFFVSVLFVLLPLVLILNKKKLNLSFILKLGVPLFFSSVILALLSLPYLSFIKTFQFDRGLQRGADLANYLAVDFTNVFLSRLLTPLGRHEHYLFPGIAALFFSAFFLYKKKSIFSTPPKAVKFAFLILFIGVFVFILLTGLTGRSSTTSGLISTPIFILLMIGIIYALLSIGLFINTGGSGDTRENSSLVLYIVIGIWTMLLSFGSHFSFLGKSTSVGPLPFKLFFNYVPGFKGIRVPSRYAVFVIFCVAVLAAFGLKYFFDKFDKKKVKLIAATGLFIFLNLEYLSVPQQIKGVPVKDDIPPAYVWLKDKPGDFVIASLPFFNETPMEANYLYFSLFHKKKIINGYSGFVPPVTQYMQRIFKGFPSWPSVDILKSLGVDYVIYHPTLWENKMASARVERIETDFSDDLKLIESFSYEFKKPNALSDFFGEDRIYQVTDLEDGEVKHDFTLFSKLDPPEWTVTASKGAEKISFLYDENLDTKWDTNRPKKTEDFLLIEFKNPVSAARVALHLGKFQTEYALNLRAEISFDGLEWTNISRPYSAGEFTTDWIKKPLDPVQNVYVEGEKIKYIKIIHIGNDTSSLWSAAEMDISVIY